MLLGAALTGTLGYRGIKLSARFGVLLGAFEMFVFTVPAVWLIVKAGAGNTASVFTLKYATVKVLSCTIIGVFYLFTTIALPLALGYGPVIAYELLATIVTAAMPCIYIVADLSAITYHWRRARGDFNWLLHLVLPPFGSIVLLPVLAEALGVGSSVLSFVSPLPSPINRAGVTVGAWFLLGVLYLGYLLLRHPDRVRDMEQVLE